VFLSLQALWVCHDLLFASCRRDLDQIYRMLICNDLQKAGIYTGKKFIAICYFFGYQARGSFHCNFDCHDANVSASMFFVLAPCAFVQFPNSIVAPTNFMAT